MRGFILGLRFTNCRFCDAISERITPSVFVFPILLDLAILLITNIHLIRLHTTMIRFSIKLAHVKSSSATLLKLSCHHA